MGRLQRKDNIKVIKVRRSRTSLNSDLNTRKEYSTDVVQQKYDYNGMAKGPGLKIVNGYELVEFIENEILKRKK